MTDPRLAERLRNGERVWFRGCGSGQYAYVSVCYDQVFGMGGELIEWSPNENGPWRPVEVEDAQQD